MADIIERFIEVGLRQAQSTQNFVSTEIQTSIEGKSEEELDSYDFGIIKVDDNGKILYYNKYESELANVAKTDAIGKNFFYDIAPCTNNRLFLGSFKLGVEKGEINILFFYTFTYRMKPTNVRILFLKKKGSNSNWIFVKKNF